MLLPDNPARAVRRRRATGLLALILAVGAIAVVVTRSTAQPTVPIDSATAWLLSLPRNSIDRVNALVTGPGSATTDSITVAFPRGQQVTTRRREPLIIMSGGDGATTVLDLRTLRATPVPLAATAAPPVLESVQDRIFVLDTALGRVDLADGHDVGRTTTVYAGGGRIERWEVSAGALWLTTDQGTVTRVDPTGTSWPVTGVFRPGQQVMLAPTQDGVALLNLTTGRIDRVRGARPRVEPCANRPDTINGSGRAYRYFAVAPDGRYAALLGGTDTATLTLVSLTEDTPPTTRALPGAGTDYGAPVLSSGHIYLARQGSLVVVGIGPELPMESGIEVTATATRLELFLSGTVVWANDPNGPRAAAVIGGTARVFDKYDTRRGPTATNSTTPERVVRFPDPPAPTPRPSPTATPSPSIPSPSPSPSLALSPSVPPTTPPTTIPATGPTTGPPGGSPSPTSGSSGCDPWPTHVEGAQGARLTITVSICAEPRAGHEYWLVDTGDKVTFRIRAPVSRTRDVAVDDPEPGQRTSYVVDVPVGEHARMRQALTGRNAIRLPAAAQRASNSLMSGQPGSGPTPTTAPCTDTSVKVRVSGPTKTFTVSVTAACAPPSRDNRWVMLEAVDVAKPGTPQHNEFLFWWHLPDGTRTATKSFTAQRTGCGTTILVYVISVTDDELRHLQTSRATTAGNYYGPPITSDIGAHIVSGAKVRHTITQPCPASPAPGG